MNRDLIAKAFLWAGLIAFFFLLSWFFTYSIHDFYPLPYHSDEWDHIAIANEIARTDGLVNYNPYWREGWDPQWEQNYHVLMVLLMNATGWDVADLGGVYVALFIPVLMTFLMVFFTFLLVRHLTGSNIAGLIASVTVLLTRPNPTLLGYWFAVPMAFGLAFIPMVLFLFVKAFSSKGYAYFAALSLVFANLTLVHPASAIIFLPAFFVYLMIHPKLLVQNKYKMAFVVLELAALALLMVTYSIADFSFGTRAEFIETVFRTITFTTSLYEVQVFFFLPRFLTWAGFALGLIGMGYMLLLRNREAKILPLLAITLVPLIYLFFTQERIFLADYRRVFMYVATVFAILSGIGIYAIVSGLNHLLKKKISKLSIRNKIGLIRFPQALIALVVGFLLLNQLLLIPFTHLPYLYRVIEEDDVPAILWLKHNSNIDEVVLALPGHSRAIHGIAGNKVLYVNMARLRGPRGEEEAFEFLSVGCEQRAKMLYGRPNFVYSAEPLGCDFLKEVYSINDRHVYRVDYSEIT